MNQRDKRQLAIAVVDFMRSFQTPTFSYQAVELLSDSALVELRDSLKAVAQGQIDKVWATP
jgi:hypothetical protein